MMRRLLIVGLLIVAVAAVLVVKERSQATVEPEAEGPAGLPRLVDLGADKCVQCKMLAPILEELKTEYAGRMEVVFIDVWKNKGEAEKYGVRMIPTQIFYGADGQELVRHEGFISKADILAAWAEHGYTFGEGS